MTRCAYDGCTRPPKEHVGRGMAPIYCWRHAKRANRRGARTMPKPATAAKPVQMVNPIAHAWNALNRDRPVLPGVAELIAAGGHGAVQGMLEQRERPEKFWPSER